MTVATPCAVSCGDGARSTIVVSREIRVLKTYQRRRPLGGFPCGAVDSKRHEAMNCERSDGPRQEPEVAVVDVALPPPRVQEPAKRKRGGIGASAVLISWAVKKQRSAITGGSERGSAIADVNGVAAASPSSLIVQETAGIWLVEKWTGEEMEVAAIMMELSELKDGERS